MIKLSTFFEDQFLLPLPQTLQLLKVVVNWTPPAFWVGFYTIDETWVYHDPEAKLASFSQPKKLCA